MMTTLKKTAAALCALMMIAVFAGCSGSRTKISAEGFESAMTGRDFQIEDSTSQFSSSLVKKVLLAAGEHYQIEYFELQSEDIAQSSYQMNVDSFEAKKSGVTTHASVSAGNYSYYQLTSGGEYYTVSRVEDTFLYAHVDEEYKAEVQEIFKELGY